MKADTIEQYKILEYIEQNFNMDSITVKLIDRNTVEVADQKGDSIEFKYINNKIEY